MPVSQTWALQQLVFEQGKNTEILFSFNSFLLIAGILAWDRQ